MPNISFQIESVRAERYSFEPVAQLSVNMNIVVGKIEKVNQGFAASFLIKLEYAPPVAAVDMKGRALIAPLNDEERQELEKSAASGQPPPQLVASIFSYALPVLALLTREIGLPPPVPLPLPAPQQERQPRAPGYV
ncbi:MAG: hypothetical protein LM580_08430 [Thermofilum sp.]|nr:hypothetical protein [Thermofilum sp.]